MNVCVNFVSKVGDVLICFRTNKFVELIKNVTVRAKESGTIQDFHKRYPIPDTEIKTNDAFGPEDQNPGYSK